MAVHKQRLLGERTCSTAVVEKVVQANALNLTGELDYNKYGIQDGKDLVCCSQIFVDNFLLSLLIPDTLLLDGRKFSDVSSVNRIIRDTLKSYGLNRCSVKAVGTELLTDEEKWTEEEKQKLAYSKDPCSKYYFQNFKIACSDENMDAVMSYLREEYFNNRKTQFTLRDLDCSLDCQGSFSKKQIMDHMTDNCGFRMQGGSYRGLDETPGTILDNDSSVGRNCLTYMAEADGFKVRCKVYNKFVQCLETIAVRTNVGQHWKDWVEREGTRLASSRDKAQARGLTRVEVTFYIKANKQKIPSDRLIARTLENITSYIPKHLVYSTPYEATWRAYCECMVHTLVVVEEAEEQRPEKKRTATIVYSYNEVTGKISGQKIRDWDKREKWCLANMALGGNLPIDIIDVELDSSERKSEMEKKRLAMELSAKRYFRHRKDGSTRFKTQVTSTAHSQGPSPTDQTRNNLKLTKAGFVPTENCTPDLSESGRIDTKKVDMVMAFQQTLPVSVSGYNDLTFVIDEKKKALEQYQKFDKELDDMRQERETIDRFNRAPHLKLLDMHRGQFPVFAIKQCGLKGFKVIIDFKSQMVRTTANEALAECIRDCIPLETRKHLKTKREGWLFCNRGAEIGELIVKGYQYISRNKSMLCCINFHPIEHLVNLNITTGTSISADCVSPPTPASSPGSVHGHQIPTTDDQDVCAQKYLQLESLAAFPDKSELHITSFAHCIYRNSPRLIAKVGEKWYQAGEDVEKKKHLMTTRSEIVKLKQRKSRKNGRYEAIVEIMQKSGQKRTISDPNDEGAPPQHRRKQ